MKKTIFTLTFLTLIFASSVAAQTPRPALPANKASVVRFPGISDFQMEQLREAKKITAIPLPTWVPTGFRVAEVKLRLGSMVEIQDRVLTVVYARKLANGKSQRFALEAGFDGLGDLPYDVTKVISSGVGQIEFMYEPNDEDGKIKDYVMTEWFKVGETDFHYDGMYGNDRELTMISLGDTEKILKSLQRL